MRSVPVYKKHGASTKFWCNCIIKPMPTVLQSGLVGYRRYRAAINNPF